MTTEFLHYKKLLDKIFADQHNSNINELNKINIFSNCFETYFTRTILIIKKLIAKMKTVDNCQKEILMKERRLG